ncbi:hypothetical protein [Methanolapillus ohkumae]|uniref:Uncharacterized protein n=1 Tax=Methanolapillus ohkumae TaxID=3028298 RepID=A0AA96ZWY2_9EURY|nr:hypothetical protein MsAm2_08840 [Methanosarcinaceae archaeon Am2]
MIKKYLIFFVALTLISTLFIPGVMAQENKKNSSNYIVKQLDDSEATYLSQEDSLEIEEIAYMLLESDGIIIENLDLSNIKKLEKNDDLILAGKITYDVKSINGKPHNLSSLNSQEIELYTCFNKTEGTFKLESSSNNNQYYGLNLYKEISSNGESKYVSEEKYTVNGNLNAAKNIIFAPDYSISDSSDNFITLASSGWQYPPSNPPSGSLLAYSDAKLSDIIAATSIVAGVVTAIITTAAGAGIIASATSSLVISLATLLMTSVLPDEISADYVYVDFYFTIYPRPFYNASPAIGSAHPTAPIYIEANRYYVM